MEHIRLGGRPTPGFGVGNPLPQSSYVKPANQSGSTGKIGAFLGGAIMSGIAGITATSLFAEGAGISLATVSHRLQRNWRVLAATAVAGGIVGAIVR